MVEVRFVVDSSVAPEAVLAAATDFSERRPVVWPSIDPAVYEVHRVNKTSADVTEGEKSMGGIWARECYDWSTPGVVRAEVQDSNVFRAGSSWELRVDPKADGGSRITWTTRRIGKGKGRVLALMLRLAGKKVLEQRLRQTLAALEDEQATRRSR